MSLYVAWHLLPYTSPSPSLVTSARDLSNIDSDHMRWCWRSGNETENASNHRLYAVRRLSTSHARLFINSFRWLLSISYFASHIIYYRCLWFIYTFLRVLCGYCILLLPRSCLSVCPSVCPCQRALNSKNKTRENQN